MTATHEPLHEAWQDSCDVLVIGFGAAGACAALEATEQGAQVLVVDRFQGGGASAMSGGVVYLGGGTTQQQAAGYADTPQAMFDYLRHEVGDTVSAETLRRFCYDSVAMGQWLEARGVQFDASMPPLKTSYPSDSYYLYYSGNETVVAYQGAAAPAPRGHRVKGHGMSGSVLFSTMAQAVRRSGVRVAVQSKAERLLTDHDGRVVGVEFRLLRQRSLSAWLHRRIAPLATSIHNLSPALATRLRNTLSWLEQRFGQPWRVEARQGVVLSSGGFIFNRELVARHAPAYQTTWPLGSPGCDGSALRLGQALGAATAHLERASAWRFINPPYGWVKGILVNRNGERFCNEELYGAAIGHALVEQGGQAWLILDAKQYRAALREACFGKLWAFQSVPALILMLLARRKARSVAALAGKLGMRPELLESTLAQYSAAARAGADPVFGKSPSLLNPLEHAPFYALNVSADSRLFPCPAITLGGLRVDEGSGAVLDQQQRPIPGLYAAGRAAVGIASRYYVSGLSLADCIWSGRRAGAHAAFPMAEHGLIHEEITDDASR